jgi:hypothetical protein
MITKISKLKPGLILLFTGVFFFGVTIYSEDNPREIDQGDQVTAVQQVKVYQGASIKSKLIATLPEGSKLLAAKNYNGKGWLHVKPADKKNAKFKSGWIQVDRVKTDAELSEGKGKCDKLLVTGGRICYSSGVNH